MRENRTKSRLRDGQLALGCALQQYRSPEIPRLLAASGERRGPTVASRASSARNDIAALDFPRRQFNADPMPARGS